MFKPLAAILLLVLLVAPLSSVHAQDFQTGDMVWLVERELGIPAHPAPSDSSVAFRFISGSQAMVLNVDGESGWIEIRGEPATGEAHTGWITPRYIASSAPEVEEGPGTLGWCPEEGSPTARVAGRLRIATWNLENLHAQDGQSTYLGDDPSVKRFATDYERIRCYVRLIDPDILAVQEVDGVEALSRVVDTDVYDVFVSDRPLVAPLNGKQNTGFAVRRGLMAERLPDFEALDIAQNGTLRYGTQVSLTINSQTLIFMSVHLKSGCFNNGSSSTACSRLGMQVPVLESWIDDAAMDSVPFVVMGDFNRRFNRFGDDVWSELDDGEPANADLTAITENMPISCRDNEYTEFIDHIVFDARSTQWVDRSSFRHVSYRQADKDVWNKISDHCPVVVEMWVP
jgi:endonuclease/exonuclease/phosphatase family metal-dependent hydrolase